MAEYEEPMPKKSRHSIITEEIFDLKFQELFCNHWHNRTAFKNADIEIIPEPFRVCKVSNFLSEQFMDDLKNELVDVKTRRSAIDLYQFEQSKDLAEINRSSVNTLYDIFQTDLADWMQKNTNIILDKKISMTMTCYYDCDYLLCHDDNLGDRRIAYILYLSQDWTKEDGGALDLFDTDEDGLPRNVVKSIIPEYNSLVMFEVTNNSYHQVAEILAPDKTRWTINGWFHGPVVEQLRAPRPEPVINYVRPECTVVDLTKWVSKNYLYSGIKREIQEDVEQDSYTFLSNFLEESVYQRLSQEIQSDDIKWNRVGPPDVRNYEVADEDSLPPLLAEFCQMFRSITIFQLMKSYTELDLVPLTDDMNPMVTIELQRWSTGCYALINDKYNIDDPVENEACSEKKDDTGECEDVEEIIDAVRESSSSPEEAKVSIPKDYLEVLELGEESVREEARSRTPPSNEGDVDDSSAEEPAVERKRRPKKRKTPKKKKSNSTTVVVEQLPPVKIERDYRNTDVDDSDVSDIGDYLSDHDECSDQEDQPKEPPTDQPEDEPEPEAQPEDEPEDEREDEAEDEAEGEPQPEPEVQAEEVEMPAEAQAGCSGSRVTGAKAAYLAAIQMGKWNELDVIMQFHTSNISKDGIDYVDPREEDAAILNVPPKDNHLCLIYKTDDICRVHKYVNHLVDGYYYNLICTYLE